MSNNIIKSFDINPNSGDIVSDGVSLFFNIVVNKRNLLRKNTRFIKICVVKTSDLTNKESNVEGYSSSYLNKISRNNFFKIKQYEYENNPITVTDDNNTYEELTFGIKLNTVESIINEVVNIIDPQTDGIIGTVTSLKENSHTIKIYFLDKNKNIIENYSYKQNDNIRLKDYITQNFENEIFNLLSNSLDVNFRNYNMFLLGQKEIYYSGPFIVYNDILNNIENFNSNEIKVSINLNEKIYDFSKRNIQLKMIENYKSGLIFDLYNYFLGSSETDVVLDFSFSYNDNIFLKSKTISKDKVLELYNGYFSKFKNKFIYDSFKDKIRISSFTPNNEKNINKNQSLSSFRRKININFSYPDLTYISPVIIDNNNISIELKASQGEFKSIEKLYTTSNLDEDNILSSSLNNTFDFNSIFDINYLEKGFYIEKIFLGVLPDFIIKIKNLQIYPVLLPEDQFEQTEDMEDNDNLFEDSDLSNIFDKMIDFNNFIRDSRNLKFKLNKKLVYNNKLNFSEFGYNTTNNDYLFNEISKNSIIQYKISYLNSKNERIEEIKQDEVYNLITEDSDGNSYLNLFTNSSLNDSDMTISCRSISLPNNTLSKVGKEIVDNIEDEKEKISSFLNKSFPNKFNRINKIIDKDLYNSGKNKKDIIRKILNVPENKNFKTVTLNKSKLLSSSGIDSQVDFNLESKNILEKSSIFNVKNQILNLSLNNDQNITKFESYMKYKKESNYIKVFKKKKDSLIASLNLENFLKNKNYTKLSFHISMMITLEFDSSNFNNSFTNSNDSIYKNKILLEDGSYKIYNNLSFRFNDNNLLIISPFEESNFSISQGTFNKINSLWGKDNSLYFNNVLERFCIIVYNNNKVVSTININNYINKDYSLENNFSNKTYLLNKGTSKVSDLKIIFK